MAGPSYREHVDAALKSDRPESALDVGLAAFGARSGDHFTAWNEVVQHLGRQAAPVRSRLLDALPGRYARAATASEGRLGLLHLCAVLAHDLPHEVLVAERRAAVAALDDRWVSQDRSLLYLAGTELYSGRALSSKTVATVRRSARLFGDPGWAALAAQLAEPVLSVGEAWADTALADARVAGPRWMRLLAHAATAMSARPTVAWERRASGLLIDMGNEAARERILSWINLVGLPRTSPVTEPENTLWPLPNERLDPFNADALRGLTWILALMPPGDDVALAMGVLADAALRPIPRHGLRSPKVANAAVNTLSRTKGPVAAAELRRLMGRVTHKRMLQTINNALVAQGVFA